MRFSKSGLFLVSLLFAASTDAGSLKDYERHVRKPDDVIIAANISFNRVAARIDADVLDFHCKATAS